MEIEFNKNNQTTAYRRIFKATSLFGGVQIYQILIELIKSKFIALLLGPTGVGIQGLYTSAISLIQQATSCGLSTSAIRNVAEANESDDKTRIGFVVTALRRLVWLTGLFGMFVVVAFSSVLSKISFGDSKHVVPFIIISITLLLGQLNVGQKVILQGTRHIKYLAKCTAIGVTIGLIVCVPLYYLWGIDAIVYNIIISYITALSLSWYYSTKISVTKVKQSWKKTFAIGKSMLMMGAVLTLTHLMTTASGYALRSFIRLWGGVEAVGLFTAGYVIMNQYAGLVFSAMATDYYPRLSAINSDNYKCKDVMNKQGEIGLLLLSPLLVIFIIFVPIVIELLYSSKFLLVCNYVVWCSFGMIFKLISWVVSFVFLAKSETKLYAFSELYAGLYMLGLNLVGYKYGGLSGLGMSFSLGYFIYMLQVGLLARKRYGLKFSSDFVKLFFVQCSMIIMALISHQIIGSRYIYIIGSFLCLISILFSLKELNNRLNFYKKDN